MPWLNAKRLRALSLAVPQPGLSIFSFSFFAHVRNGSRWQSVVEQPDAIKSILVRWNGVKIDLAELAKLRWIEKRTTPEICRITGRKRTAVRDSIRTLRKSQISELNLTDDERKLIEKAIKLENERNTGKVA